MIGVFIGDIRIGSIMHFPKLIIPCWVAYASEGRQSFKTRKQAIAWLTEMHETANKVDQHEAAIR